MTTREGRQKRVFLPTNRPLIIDQFNKRSFPERRVNKTLIDEAVNGHLNRDESDFKHENEIRDTLIADSSHSSIDNQESHDH